MRTQNRPKVLLALIKVVMRSYTIAYKLFCSSYIKKDNFLRKKKTQALNLCNFMHKAAGKLW